MDRRQAFGSIVGAIGWAASGFKTPKLTAQAVQDAPVEIRLKKFAVAVFVTEEMVADAALASRYIAEQFHMELEANSGMMPPGTVIKRKYLKDHGCVLATAQVIDKRELV